NSETAGSEGDSKDELTLPAANTVAPDDLVHSTTFASARLRRRRSRTGSRENLRAATLAQAVASIQIEPFSYRHIFDRFPKEEFGPSQAIPCEGPLYVIERGWVQIRHARDKYPIKTLAIGAVFGEMPEMGQTMLASEAVAGPSGATLTTMNLVQAWQWIAPDP